MTGSSTTTPGVSAGRRLVESLFALGVRNCYCVPGESYLEVLDALAGNPGSRLVSTRHESGASFMAEAEGKLTGVPAIAAATRAPGAANLAIGVHTALHDSTPLIAVLGQVESELLGTEGAFQGIDLEAFYRPITKWTATLSAGDDVDALARAALAVATSGRPGPVVLVLPSGLQLRSGAGGGAPAPEEPGAGGPLADGPRHAEPGPVEPEVVRAIVEQLAVAERPVMIVGGRTAACRAELIELSERLGIGVYSSFRRQDRFPNDHPGYLGHLTIATVPSLLDALRDADVVLCLGCRLSEVTTQRFSLPSARSVLIDVDSFAHATFPGKSPDLAVVADVPATLAALARAARSVGTCGGLERFGAAHAAYLEASTPPELALATSPLHPSQVVATMAARLPEDCILANDAGNFSIFLHRYWRYRHPLTQLAPTSGAMGYGVPAAIAAALRRPRQLAVAVAGDGGYLMTGQELETAARLGVKVLVVVMRNGLYGTIAMHQARGFGRLAAVDIGEVDLAAHARSLGAAGYSVQEAGQLGDALAEALACEGPALLDVAVDADVLAPGVSLAGLLERAGRLRA